MLRSLINYRLEVCAEKHFDYNCFIELKQSIINPGSLFKLLSFKLTSASSHLPQKCHMRSHRIPHLRVFDIDQSVFFASLPDNVADGRVMDMRNFGEKMMFDLKIQSTH